MHIDKKWLVNPHVSCRVEDEDGAILYNPENDATQVINPVGLDIWRSIEKKSRTVSEIIMFLQKQYMEIPGDQVEKDVSEFVSNLSRRGFVGELLDDAV